MERRIARLMSKLLVPAFVSAFTVVGAWADDAGPAAAPVPAGDVSFASGAEIYAHLCQGCHMANAQGAEGAGHYPKLAGNSALSSWQYVAITVLNGKRGMPAFGNASDQVLAMVDVHLSDAQVAEVVNHVRTHFGNHYSGTVTESQVAALPHPGTDATP